jgi:hypothetical protein
VATLDLELDARSVQPADLVTGWVHVGGADAGAFDAVLVGLFGRDADGAVFGETFVAPLEEAGGRRRARFVVPVPPDAAPATLEDATCMLLARLGTADGQIAAESVAPIAVEAAGAGRATALRQCAAAMALAGESPERALAVLEPAAASLVGYAPAHALLGDLIYAVRRNEAAARQAWERARHCHPLALDTGFADFRLALNLALAGELERARALVEAAVAAAPHNAAYHEALAALLARAGARAEAETELGRALAERDTPGALRGLMNLYEEAGRDAELYALGERLYEALAAPGGEAAAEALRAHCEYFYLVARAAARRGFKGAARRWVARYFAHFDAGERAAGTFTGSPFAQHGDEDWFVEVAAAAGLEKKDDPYLRMLESQQAKAAPAGAEAGRAPGSGAEAGAGAARFEVLPSGIILGPRFFEPRDAAALRARWGEPAAAAKPPALYDGPTPALSRRGAERWDSPVFDPAFRSPKKKEGE